MDNRQYSFSEGPKFLGEYFAFSLPKGTKESDPIVDELRQQVRSGHVSYPCSFAKNIVPTTGLNLLTRALADDATYDPALDWGAIGNGVSPSFTLASTTLSSEQYRKQASSLAFDDNIVYADFFYASGDLADGDYTEFGVFNADGSAAADSGRAWSLVAFDYTKSGSLYISGRWTLTNA